MNLPTSLFDRLFARPWRPWLRPGVALLLFLAPLAAAYAENGLGDLLSQGAWRGLLLPPTVITYILLVSPRLARMETDVLKSFRALVLVDDDSFNRLVSEAAHIESRNEIIAFGTGALVGLLTVAGSSDASVSWLTLEWFLSTGLMYGLLAWTIYVSLASTRLTAALLHQPLRVDPFDITPFEPIGRQSLLLALVFVGGITLSLLFVVMQPATLLRPEFWLIYIPLASVPVIIFFMGMYPTHQVLAAAKERELQAVQRHLQRSCRDLLQRLDQNQDTGRLPAEINALVAYDQRLQMTGTWPYNTTMLRTLVFSALIPGGTVLGRIVLDMLFN